jgi:hypothetical protein
MSLFSIYFFMKITQGIEIEAWVIFPRFLRSSNCQDPVHTLPGYNTKLTVFGSGIDHMQLIFKSFISR